MTNTIISALMALSLCASLPQLKGSASDLDQAPVVLAKVGTGVVYVQV
jgi:hypothetical protein